MRNSACNMSLIERAREKGWKPSKTVPIAPKQTKQTQGETGVSGVATGAGKGIISTLTGVSSLGERMLKGIGRAVTPKPFEKALGFEKEKMTAAERLVPEALRTPAGTAEKIGFAGEQIAEFFVPGGVSTKVGKALETGFKAKNLGLFGRIAQKAVPLAGRATTEAAIVGGQTAMQRGKVDTDSAVAAIVGAAFPLAGVALKPVTKGAIGLGAEILGKSTGAGAVAIKEAFKNPAIMRVARLAGVDGVEGLQNKAVETAKSALIAIKKTRGKTYESALAAIKTDKTQMDDIALSVQNKVRDLFGPDEYDVSFVRETGTKLNKLDFSGSVITEGTVPIERAVNDITNWTDWTAAGLDKLKKRLGAYVDQTPFKTPARSLLTELRSNLDDQLKTNVSGYLDMTKGYREASELIEEIEKGLSLGNKVQMQTTVTKLMSTMRQNFELRNEMMKALEKAGGGDISEQIAAATLAPLMPRGLVGALAPAGIPTAAVLAPSNIPLLMMVAASTSPRLVGELVSALGQTYRGAGKTIEMTPGLKTILQRIFGEGENIPKAEGAATPKTISSPYFKVQQDTKIVKSSQIKPRSEPNKSSLKKAFDLMESAKKGTTEKRKPSKK